MGGVKFKFSALSLGFLLLLPFCAVYSSTEVTAKSGDNFWSWTDEEPKILYSKLIDEINYDKCPTLLRTIEISGEIGEYSACIYGDNAVSFTNYWLSGLRFAIKLPNDSKMHKFYSECGMYNPCIYLPDTDSLVMKRSIGSGGAGLLLIYKNFTKRLIPIQNGLIREYNFDDSEPDYTSHFPGGDYWLINGLNVSDNGNWLVAEALDRGFVLINIKTLETKQIDNQIFRYGFGMNPTLDLAVSSDGHHLAVTGINGGFRIADIDDSCGAEMSYHNVPKLPISNPCKDSPLNINLAIDWFRAGYRPHFSDDGGELTFYAESNLFEKREITLRASRYQTKVLQYLALGDSFTSGEGELDDKYYLPRTNDEFEKCHLSSRSYPFLLTKLQNFNPSLSKSVACSGATIGDITGDNLSYGGQGGRLAVGNGKMNLHASEKLIATNQAEQDFIPGRVRQSDFVEKYKPKLITIGIGGNDAGLMGKLAACAGPGTCEWVSDEAKKAQTANEISNLFDRLVKTYQSVYSKSNNSKIYAVGYPKIIDPSGSCGPTIGTIFSDDEKVFMNESISYLNQVIFNAAKRAGIGYIDIESSLGDQVLCGRKKPSAMNGVKLGDDSKVAWAIGIGNETFHPNSIGHELVAGELKNKINNNYCQNSKAICPDETVKSPLASSYWSVDGEKEYPKQQNSSFLQQSDDQNKLTVELEEYSLEPGSEVKIEIQSEPTAIGVFKVGEDGSLNAGINLPDDLEYGYHTIYIYGKSYSGEDVQLYQIVKHSDVETGVSSVSPVHFTKEKESENSVGSSFAVAAESVDDKSAVEAITLDENPEQAVLGDDIVTLSKNKITSLNKNNTLGVLTAVIGVFGVSFVAFCFKKLRP